MSANGTARAIYALQNAPGDKKATVYIARDYVVKATRKDKLDRRNKSETFVVTMGRPNYLERKFIKLCEKAGEPFPVKKVVLKPWPVARAGTAERKAKRKAALRKAKRAARKG